MANTSRRKRPIDNRGQFTQDRTSHARRLVPELVTPGQRTTSEISAELGQLIERARRRRDDLKAVGRAAVAHQREVIDHATNIVLTALSYRLFGGRDRQRSR